MLKENIVSLNFIDDFGASFKVIYSIVSDIFNDSCKIYGLEIEKFENSGLKEKSAVYGLSDNKNKVLDFIKKLSDYEVTPISLTYVMEDMIA